MGSSKGTLVCYCYIPRCSDDSFYVGVTDDPAQRVRDHNEGSGASWTAVRRPVRFLWIEEHAQTRESVEALEPRKEGCSGLGVPLDCARDKARNAHLATSPAVALIVAAADSALPGPARGFRPMNHLAKEGSRVLRLHPSKR